MTPRLQLAEDRAGQLGREPDDVTLKAGSFEVQNPPETDEVTSSSRSAAAAEGAGAAPNRAVRDAGADVEVGVAPTRLPEEENLATPIEEFRVGLS
eukprot:gene13889-biopygen8686